ncbi:hypothetical protein MNEG_14245, partial [Monoraphidium neglectum]
VRSTRIDRVGPWLPSSWLARALHTGAEVSFTESDAVAVRPDAGPGAGGAARGDGVERTLARTLRLRRARWLPGAEWRVVDIVDAA